MKKFLPLMTLLALMACSSNAEKISEQMKKGNAFMDQRNYSSALTCFRDALDHEPDAETMSKIYRNMAVVFLYQQQNDSARHYSKLGMDCLPENSYYHLINMAEYELLNDEVSKAIQTFEKAKLKDATQMEVYNNLSLIYSGAYGEQYLNLDKALVNAKKAYDLSPEPVNEEQLGSVCFQLEKYKDAIKHFRSLQSRYPEVKMYQFYLGQSLYFDGQETEGMQLMEEAAERDEECRRLFESLTQSN